MDEAQMVERLNKILADSGERDRLKAVLKKKLVETGWHDRVQAECEAEIRRRGIDSVTAQELVDYTTSKAKTMIPEGVRQEVLTQIQQFLDSNSLI